MITTVNRTHPSANEFREMLLVAPPGTPVTYFTGELGHDLHMAALAKDPNAAELRLVVELAITGSDAGELRLRRSVSAIFSNTAQPRCARSFGCVRGSLHSWRPTSGPRQSTA